MQSVRANRLHSTVIARWSLGVLWVAARVCSFAVVILALTLTYERAGFPAVLLLSCLVTPVAAILAMALLGCAQYFILRRFGLKGEWLIATIWAELLGMILSAILLWFLSHPRVDLPSAFVGLVVGVVFGSAVGGAQWLELKQHLENGDWWVLTNIVAGAAGGSVAMLLKDVYQLPGATAVLLFQAVFGAITGSVWVRLLRHPLHQVTTGPTTGLPENS